MDNSLDKEIKVSSNKVLLALSPGAVLLYRYLAIGALGKEDVSSSIYIRALLRGTCTSLRPLMEADTADDNKISLKYELTGSNSRQRNIYDFRKYTISLYIIFQKLKIFR